MYYMYYRTTSILRSNTRMRYKIEHSYNEVQNRSYQNRSCQNVKTSNEYNSNPWHKQMQIHFMVAQGSVQISESAPREFLYISTCFCYSPVLSVPALFEAAASCVGSCRDDFPLTATEFSLQLTTPSLS